MERLAEREFRRRLPAGGINVARIATSFAHTVPLQLEHLLSSPGSTSIREEHNSHLARCEDVSPDGIGNIGVSWTYFSTHGSIEVSHQKECRVHEYEVSICEEEGSWGRELVLPEEIDFAVDGDEVLKEDEYWEDTAISIVPWM